MFPNGLHPDERRFHALMVARDCLADTGAKSEAILKFAQECDAFLSGEQKSASVVSFVDQLRK